MMEENNIRIYKDILFNIKTFYIIFSIILITILFYYYENIYNYIINYIFTNISIEKQTITNANKLDIQDNIIYNDKLLKKKPYDLLFKDNILSYKQNLNKRISFLKNNIDITIQNHLSQPKPNYRLIMDIKEYKDKLNLINTDTIKDIKQIELDLENINNKIFESIINK